MSKRNFPKPDPNKPKKQKKAQTIKIQTFMGEITVENSKINRTISNLIEASNKGNFSYKGTMSNEQYKRFTETRRSNQNGRVVIKKALHGRKINEINKNEGTYEVFWYDAYEACKNGEKPTIDDFSFDDIPGKTRDEKIMNFIKENLLQFLYVSSQKAINKDEKDVSIEANDEER